MVLHGVISAVSDLRNLKDFVNLYRAGYATDYGDFGTAARG